jgi:drug/metabolite transporter (DMT)-like permease
MVYGTVIMVVASVVNACMNICNRRLQQTHFSVVMFWHAILGFSVPLVIIIAYAITTQTTFMVYPSGMAYLWIFLGACCDLMATTFNVLAFQNDSSSFLSLMAYTGVVYAFLFDFFLFKVSISGLQLIFALGIMVVTVAMAVYKYHLSYQPAKKEGEDDIFSNLSHNVSF